MTGSTFLLCHDIECARALRRHLIGSFGATRIHVGTWPELVNRVAGNFLLSTPLPQCSDAFAAITPSAFWERSYEVDPAGVDRAVTQAWAAVRMSLAPDAPWPTGHANPRVQQRLKDLSRLNDLPVANWPEEMRTLHELFQCTWQPIKPITVIASRHLQRLTAWQTAALTKLAEAAPAPDPVLVQAIADFDQQLNEPKGAEKSFLKHMQSNLYRRTAEKKKPDESVRLIGVRDALESAEVTTSWIQSTLKADRTLRPRDLGVLARTGSEALPHLIRLLDRAGIPVANAPALDLEQDLGGELIRHTLLALRGPSPIIAMQALLTNPLMPWPSTTGHELAANLNNQFKLRTGEGFKPAWRKLAEVLMAGQCEINQLDAVLAIVDTALNRDETFAEHRERAQSLIQELRASLQQGETNWDALIQRVSHRPVSSQQPAVLQEGITIYIEGRLPWRPVRQLFVLDFNEGAFPTQGTMPLTFSPAKWRELAASGIPITLTRDVTEASRTIFRTQLSQVSERVTFLIPGRDALGQSLRPSVSANDLALLTKAKKDKDNPLKVEDLVLVLERSADRERIADLPLARRRKPKGMTLPTAGDIQLGTDLTAGNRLSPSGADKLLVSPLAWLLQKLGCEDETWEPESFDPMTSGLAAHKAFEELFPAEAALPSEEEIQERTPQLNTKELRRISPFLTAPRFEIERAQLCATTTKAALAWRRLLTATGLQVLANEIWLAGELDQVPLSGKADAVLQDSKGHVVVVDYKNSKHGKYTDRMRAGIEVQTWLYGEMIKAKGINLGTRSAPRLLSDLKLKGVMYWTLKDQTASANFAAPIPQGNWLINPENTSDSAEKILKERIEQLRRGELEAPRQSKLDAWEKNGLRAYAFDDSPLARWQVEEDQ